MTMRYALVTVAALMANHTLSAEIYKYRDPEGLILFSDKPLQGGYQLLWQSKSFGEISSYPPPGFSKPGYSQPQQRTSRVINAAPKTPKSGWDPVKYRRNVARYTPIIDQAARDVRLRPELLHALVRTESGYDASAVSRSGAVGLAQLMPDTARRFGVTNSYDPQQNVNGGARYLRELLELFNFDLKLALAAYNSGENTVIKYGDQIPPFPETQNYVKKVLAFYMENRVKAANGSKVAGTTPKMLGDIN